MIRSLALGIALLLQTSVCFSQNTESIRRIKQDLITAKGKDQFVLLSDLAWEYRYFNPDSSIYFASRAYTLGQSLNLKKTMARPLNFIGLAHSHSGDNLDAFEFYNKAVVVATNQNDSLQLAYAYNNIGRLFTEQGLFRKSYQNLGKALFLFSGINDSSGVAYTYQSLGALHMLQGDYVSAEENYKEAYQIRLKLKISREILSAMIQLGKLYLDQDKNNEAIRYFHSADSLANTIHDGIGIAEVKTLLAVCLINKGDLKEAEKIGKEGLDAILSSSNVRLLPGAYLTMGRVHFEKGDYLQAKAFFEKAIQISTMRKDLNARMEAHFFLWQTYRKQNNKQQELVNYNQYLVLKDSVKTLETSQREQKIRFEMEIEKQQQENEVLKAQEAKQKYLIGILIIVLLSASWLLYAQWKHRKRIQRFSGRLEERNSEIKKINEFLNLKNEVLEKHINTLLTFSRNRYIQIGNLELAARDIALITAHSLNVSRVSIWTYNEESRTIDSIVCFEPDTNDFLLSTSLHFSAAPMYFEALKRERLIIADDAFNHESTKEFAEHYLKPQNIHSMLDSTFFLDGELKGLICCEQKKAMRKWSAEDIIFVSSISDIISLAFRTAQRLEYEKQIKHQSREIALMNEVLEERVKERTEELEIQNAKLSEYAFINSHQLRGPLSRILGLINLMELDKTMEPEKIIELLRKSGADLDTVVMKITNTLHEGGHLTRKDLA